MSRIGLKPVEIKEDVAVSLQDRQLLIKGPNGESELAIPRGLDITIKENKLFVRTGATNGTLSALQGTIRNLIQNAVLGALQDYERRLELVGIGYRASVDENNLTLSVGFTEPVVVSIPTGIKARVEKNVIVLNGADKQQLGEFAAQVRRIRKPEPYKGKGIRYSGEQIRIKQGKAVKATTT